MQDCLSSSVPFGLTSTDVVEKDCLQLEFEIGFSVEHCSLLDPHEGDIRLALTLAVGSNSLSINLNNPSEVIS